MDGIAGCYSPGDANLVQKIFLATGAVQHRGKASGELAVGGAKGIYLHLRMGLGHVLAKRYGDTDADVVIPNPESGRGVSHGIAEGLGKPLLPGLAKQSQAIRTFQEAGRNKRMREVAVKFAAMDSVLAGRRIIMGDDSIVKGSVSEGGAVRSGAAAGSVWTSWLCSGRSVATTPTTRRRRRSTRE